MDIRKISTKSFASLKTDEERIKHLLKYAILAPSTHNSQPWLFKIKKNKCEVYLNKEKKIPYADPTGRDMYISMGCCIENLITSSRAYGVYKSLNLLNKNKENKIATIAFDFSRSSEISDHKILKAITKRANRRGFYTNKKIKNTVMSKLDMIAKDFNGLKYHAVTKISLREVIVNLTAKGLAHAYKNPKFRFEMSNWFISNKSKRKEGIPGYAINFPTLISIIFPFIVRYVDIGRVVSKLNKISMITAPLISVISTKRETERAWVNVGILAQRQVLALRKYGISSAVYVASIEMDGLNKHLIKLLKTKFKPQFLFCSGYIDEKNVFTPRQSVESKIIV